MMVFGREMPKSLASAPFNANIVPSGIYYYKSFNNNKLNEIQILNAKPEKVTLCHIVSSN